MVCKDEFLIQSVVVPTGTTPGMISSSLFTKDDGKYVEEKRLRVILASRSPSLVLSLMDGMHNEAPFDASILEDPILHRVETVSPQHKVTEVVESKEEKGEQLAATKALDLELVQDVKEQELVKDIDNMKIQISELVFKLKEAEVTVSKLIKEKRLTVQERETSQQELALLRSKKATRKVWVEFPFFFVCMIALISAFLGYLQHW